jgi:hypothetical protein
MGQEAPLHLTLPSHTTFPSSRVPPNQHTLHPPSGKE